MGVPDSCIFAVFAILSMHGIITVQHKNKRMCPNSYKLNNNLVFELRSNERLSDFCPEIHSVNTFSLEHVEK